MLASHQDLAPGLQQTRRPAQADLPPPGSARAHAGRPILKEPLAVGRMGGGGGGQTPARHRFLPH